MSHDGCLGILLPEDGPTDYEWYELGPASDTEDLPRIEVGKVPSDGHHEPAALMALGATDRLSPVGEGLVSEKGPRAVVWACTSGSFIGGLAWARAQAGELENRLGVPVTSTALAFLEALSAQGLEKDTLVIFTSDNGPWLSYGDHAGSAGPLREGKGTTFEGGVREPAIFRWPGKIPAGRTCRGPIASGCIRCRC